MSRTTKIAYNDVEGLKKIDRDIIKKGLISAGVVVGVITIVILAKKNKKLKKDLTTSLEGYLTLLAQHGDLNDKYFNLSDGYLTMTEKVLGELETVKAVA